MPTDGIVKETASKITAGAHGEVAKARALYEWVVEHTNRDPKVAGCGLGDIASIEIGLPGRKVRRPWLCPARVGCPFLS
jgi:hypothetical protein